MGVEFMVVYDDAEKLRGEGATIAPTMLGFLPEHDGGGLVRATRQTLALSAFNYLGGAMELDGCTSCLNAIFPEIQPLAVRDVSKTWKETLHGLYWFPMLCMLEIKGVEMQVGSRCCLIAASRQRH